VWTLIQEISRLRCVSGLCNHCAGVSNRVGVELWIWSGSSLLHWTDLSHFTKSIGNAEERRDYVSIR
jgi:hypothetical protein